MKHTPTIRSTIETELKQRGYTFSSFSKISGINRGTFSTMLNSNPPKPISVRQMDLITKALGYPEGWLYELYIDECFHEGKGTGNGSNLFYCVVWSWGGRSVFKRYCRD